MKIKPEHLEFLSTAIAPFLRAMPPAEYKAAHPEFSDKRVRWDYLWAAVPSRWICANIYPYANDEHIDTALRRIVGV